LNLNREPANGSSLDTSGAVAFATAVTVAAVAMKAILRVELAALSLSLPDILNLSSYSIIEDNQNITLGYTVGYLLIESEPIRLYTYIVQVS
jgi:hypothetical protein